MFFFFLAAAGACLTGAWGFAGAEGFAACVPGLLNRNALPLSSLSSSSSSLPPKRPPDLGLAAAYGFFTGAGSVFRTGSGLGCTIGCGFTGGIDIRDSLSSSLDSFSSDESINLLRFCALARVLAAFMAASRCAMTPAVPTVAAGFEFS